MTNINLQSRNNIQSIIRHRKHDDIINRKKQEQHKKLSKTTQKLLLYLKNNKTMSTFYNSSFMDKAIPLTKLGILEVSNVDNNIYKLYLTPIGKSFVSKYFDYNKNHKKGYNKYKLYGQLSMFLLILFMIALCVLLIIAGIAPSVNGHMAPCLGRTIGRIIMAGMIPTGIISAILRFKANSFYNVCNNQNVTVGDLFNFLNERLINNKTKKEKVHVTSQEKAQMTNK